MNWVLLIITLTCYQPNKAQEECHPNSTSSIYFQDSDLCNATADQLLKLQSREIVVICNRITRPISGDKDSGKK